MHFVAKLYSTVTQFCVNKFLLDMWQKLMIMHFVTKINDNTVFLDQGFVEYVAKIDGNALCGKNQW